MLTKTAGPPTVQTWDEICGADQRMALSIQKIVRVRCENKIERNVLQVVRIRPEVEV